jgi:penicillin-binding protein 1B
VQLKDWAQLTNKDKKIIGGSVAVVVILVIAMTLVSRNLNRVIDARLKHLMSERVRWKCADCPGIQLVPVTGQNYQPRNWAKLDEIPKRLIDSIIAVEDRRFYSHHGIDLYRTTGAMLIALKHREGPRGTSTLTQQLARTVFTSRERTLTRKFKEAAFARALEEQLSKPEILELYLNTVPFGNAGPYEVIGVADAALAFLGQRLTELQPEGIALITGMIQRPSYLNPRSRPEAALKRRNLVLKLMRLRGVISDIEEREALNKPLRLAQLQADRAHYLQAAARELGSSINASQPMEVTLTLDANLQRVASEAVLRGIDRLNKQRAKTGGRIEAALVALDPRTGAVRALVGGKDFLTSQVNRALAQRQPGSVFKPFVYAAAFEYGSRSGALSPYSEVNDIPRKFSFNGANYEPHNFGSVYHGRVTLQQALLQSLNVPAVRLAETVGYSRVAGLAKAAGLGGTAATPSAALGSYEVSPLALAGAYTAFANQGVAVRPHFIERATNWDGVTIYQAPVHPVRVMRAETAQVVVSMLRGVVQYGTAYEAGRLPFASAGKTGTDDDGWFVGFTDGLICAVWVGYDDNRNLRLEGAKSALPIWIDFMSKVHRIKGRQFGTQLPGPPAQMYGAMYHVDPPLPPDFDLDELIMSAGARLADDANETP